MGSSSDSRVFGLRLGRPPIKRPLQDSEGSPSQGCPGSRPCSVFHPWVGWGPGEPVCGEGTWGRSRVDWERPQSPFVATESPLPAPEGSSRSPREPCGPALWSSPLLRLPGRPWLHGPPRSPPPTPCLPACLPGRGERGRGSSPLPTSISSWRPWRPKCPSLVRRAMLATLAMAFSPPRAPKGSRAKEATYEGGGGREFELLGPSPLSWRTDRQTGEPSRQPRKEACQPPPLPSPTSLSLPGSGAQQWPDLELELEWGLGGLAEKWVQGGGRWEGDRQQLGLSQVDRAVGQGGSAAPAREWGAGGRERQADRQKGGPLSLCPLCAPPHPTPALLHAGGGGGGGESYLLRAVLSAGASTVTEELPRRRPVWMRGRAPSISARAALRCYRG